MCATHTQRRPLLECSSQFTDILLDESGLGWSAEERNQAVKWSEQYPSIEQKQDMDAHMPKRSRIYVSETPPTKPSQGAFQDTRDAFQKRPVPLHAIALRGVIAPETPVKGTPVQHDNGDIAQSVTPTQERELRESFATPPQ